MSHGTYKNESCHTLRCPSSSWRLLPHITSDGGRVTVYIRMRHVTWQWVTVHIGMSHVIHCATVSEQFVMIAASCHMMRWHHGTRRNETCYMTMSHILSHGTPRNESCHTLRRNVTAVCVSDHLVESRYTWEWDMSHTTLRFDSSAFLQPTDRVAVHVELR